MRLMAVLLFIEIGTLALWMVAVDSVGWLHLSVAAWIGVVFGWMLWSWWHTPAGHLTWDGVTWLLALPSVTLEAKFELVLDLQIAILLRFQTGKGMNSHWFWFEKSVQSERWLAFRRAIYCNPIALADATQDNLQSLSTSAERAACRPR
jgi:hypothetical protein